MRCGELKSSAMTPIEMRHRPPDNDEEPNTPRPPYLKEPEPDVPDPDEETGDVVRPVQTLNRNLLFSFA
jgi:hypothetical protein